MQPGRYVLYVWTNGRTGEIEEEEANKTAAWGVCLHISFQGAVGNEGHEMGKGGGVEREQGQTGRPDDFCLVRC